MTDPVDDAAEKLAAVQSAADLSAVPVADVAVIDHELRLTLDPEDGPAFTDQFSIPPSWAANCELTRLLDAVGVPRGDLDALVGVELPCQRDVTPEGMELSVDVAALTDGD
jgi:hypothetical protein